MAGLPYQGSQMQDSVIWMKDNHRQNHSSGVGPWPPPSDNVSTNTTATTSGHLRIIAVSWSSTFYLLIGSFDLGFCVERTPCMKTSPRFGTFFSCKLSCWCWSQKRSHLLVVEGLPAYLVSKFQLLSIFNHWKKSHDLRLLFMQFWTKIHLFLTKILSSCIVSPPVFSLRFSV